MRILLFGAPGVGKGTQSARVAAGLRIPAISTGDLFREHIRSRTDLGLSVQQTIAAGRYVPDAITNEMVRLRLAEPDARRGFVLDGYPRTDAQIDELDAMLDEHQAALDAVVLLEVPTDVLIERLAGRAVGGGRDDDSIEVVQRRLDLYHRETAPVAARYDHRGLLLRIDGVGTPEAVESRIAAAFARLRDGPA